ncbi:10065_t:CDS:2 [Acaulospora morrowiae]|uniref:10065_t:CDS:1 n=1 Tax=Acaulospora morrowiae TaxID=94023 RepID=A0A9N9AXS4_9GLOM|nr:10065_t:CDS:2 [Acaulospora morrowiae]
MPAGTPSDPAIMPGNERPQKRPLAIAQSPPAPSAAHLPDPSQTSSSDTKPTAQQKNSPTETVKSSGLKNGSPSRENPTTSNGSRFERGHSLIAIYSMIVGLFAVMAAMMLL